MMFMGCACDSSNVGAGHQSSYEETQAKFETVMYLGERSWDSWTDHEQGKDLPP
jgi:hypothetical protein